jgi:hypothetical protein
MTYGAGQQGIQGGYGYQGGYGQGGYGMTPGAGQGQGQGQFAPQGFFGDMLGAVGAPLGQAIGSIWGAPQTGQQIGSYAGQLGQYLPFSAGPQLGMGIPGGQLNPQGLFGGLLGSVGLGGLGGQIGSWLGNEQVGSSIGSTLGGIAGGLLPFQAGMPQAGYGMGQVPGYGMGQMH